MRPRVKRFIAYSLVLSALAIGMSRLSAQQSANAPTPTLKTVTVQVVDPQGAIIPNASVGLRIEIQSAGTAAEIFRLADQIGDADFHLRPGTYSVSIQSVGFLDTPATITVTNEDRQAFHISMRCCPINLQPGPVARLVITAPTDASTLSLILPGYRPQSFNTADIAALPHKTISFHNAHTNADETYSGIPLTDLLAKYGALTGQDLHGKALSDYIIATGADGYKAVLSLAETDPRFHPGEVIVADSMDGKPLDAKEGPFKLVVTEDKRPARSVHNLVSVELKSAD